MDTSRNKHYFRNDIEAIFGQILIISILTISFPIFSYAQRAGGQIKRPVNIQHSAKVISPKGQVDSAKEKNAVFPGGENALNSWLETMLVYPEEAVKKGIQGRVVVGFVIKKDGTISDIKIVSSSHEILNKAAIHVVSIMPKWEPAKINGNPVNSRFNLPINFSLPNNSASSSSVSISNGTLKIRNPHVRRNMAYNLKILSISLEEDKTILWLSCNNKNKDGSYSGWITIDPESYIIANDKKLKLTQALGIETTPNKTYFTHEDETILFELFFPAIPKNTLSIDFIENATSEWRMYGIELK